jgi:hypothetical protein
MKETKATMVPILARNNNMGRFRAIYTREWWITGSQEAAARCVLWRLTNWTLGPTV